MGLLRRLLQHFSSCFKRVGIGCFACCLCLQAQAMDFAAFYQQVHKQTLERNFVRFRNRLLVDVDAYALLSMEEREMLNQLYALVLVFDVVERFIYWNAQSGVGIATQRGSNLQFDIRYYEMLRHIGVGGKIYAMCVLPSFDKCILLSNSLSSK